MFNSNILDVAIGMIFIYLLLSLMCSSANEIIELMLKKRAIDLERGIRELLVPGSKSGARDIVQKLYDHALINNLFGGAYLESRIASPWRRVLRTHLPSYIPARNFALALMDLVGTVPTPAAPTAGAPAAASPAAIEAVSGAAGATLGRRAAKAQVVFNVPPAAGGQEPPAVVEPVEPPPPPAPGTADNPLTTIRNAIASNPLLPDVSRRSLITLLDAAGNDVTKARENIENWYNSSMDRVSSWYKRRAQLTILVVGFFVAIAVNVDTIAIAKRLSSDKALRESLVAASEEYAKANAAPSQTPIPTPTPTPPSTSAEDSSGTTTTTATATPTPTPRPLPTPIEACVDSVDSAACKQAMQQVCQDEDSEECRIAKACAEPNSPLCRRTRNLLLACRDEDSAKCKYLSNEQQLRSLGLPIGWDSPDDPARTWPGLHLRRDGGWLDQIYWHWLGWLLTALAISLGAPFWFDLLNKFIVIRSAVKPHEKSPEEESKD